mmetsp:Transcript_127330/g.396313  ORF Transcript_127330/g.396313 Transcript_127330/m.396313 type:complete len:355 (+) Transcript_127330:90-1154(+)
MPPVHSVAAPVKATPSGRPALSTASSLHGMASRPCALHLARLERENLRLRAELEQYRSKHDLGARRKEEDRELIRRKLKELESEVRGRWRDRVAELEAEVASLKSVLKAIYVAQAPTGPSSAPQGSMGERLRRTAPLLAPAIALAAPSAAASAPLRQACSITPDIEPSLAASADLSPQHSSSPSGTLSPRSSPRARRPPVTRAPWQVVARKVTPPRASPVRSASGAMTSRGNARPKGVAAPARAVGRPRSRSLPSASLAAGEVSDARPIGFLEAFGGFYKQLVQGTKCTGPDMLTLDERFEIDLSGEFPPERREAQVDMLAPLEASLAFERALERSPSSSTADASPSSSSLHHL